MSFSTVSIQVVTAATTSLLDRVDEGVFDHAVRPDSLREFLANPAYALVVAVADDEQVVGMATGIAYVHPDKPLSLFINEVGVSSKHQRRGVGGQLMARLLDWGKQRGCIEAWVATGVGNVAARSLYRSTGGVEDEEHAIVYVYPLASDRAHAGDA